MRKWLLAGTIVIGLLLRVIGLDRSPVGFTPDEASFGYDAYSILKTGKDQWGNPFPLVLKSFGDYKSPLFSYLLIPSVAALGLTKESVRIPSAIIGTLAILATYLLVLEMFKSKNLALAGSFLLAISSWHIMLSRGGFEANLTTFLLPLGLYFLARGLRQAKFLYLGSLVSGLNLFSYHSAKVVTPLVLLAFLILYRKELFKLGKSKLFFAGLPFFVFAVLTIYTFFQGAGTRVADVSVFNGSLEEASVARHVATDAGLNSVLAKVLYNKYGVDLKRFIANYSSYFSPQFLFVNGPAEATYGMIPGRGVLYWFELPLLIAFIVSLVKAKDKRSYLFLVFWVLIAPIPAALATGPGYAGNRAVIMLPALQILLALGFIEIPWQKYRRWALAYGLIALVFFALFLEDYFIASVPKNAQAMLYGDYEAAAWLAANTTKDKTIVVDKSLSEPHIYVAFVNKWDPIDYQQATKNWKLARGLNWVDQIPEYHLGNYVFKSVHPLEFTGIHDVYLVAKPEAFANRADFTKIITYPDGKSAIEILKI